ncbi:MAG: ATP-binding cassette domain-containing protein [Planctomycetota bacterium]
MLKFPGAVLFVNHDRAFVRALSTRVLDLDRGHLTLWDCDYGKYVERKEELLHAEEKHQKEFDRKLSEEEKWIRKGVKERRTRNQGRVRALKKMRDERRARRNRPGALKVIAQEAQKSGRLVLEAKSLTFSYGDRKILDAYSTTVVRGDKIGIIGPNGAGKSTLIRLLLGELEPDEGEVRHGTNLDIAYFDQLHRQIDENKTLEENVGDGRDSVQIDGRTRHIRGYLQDFLFSPAQARSRVDHLSGGERNRLMLAKLFSTPSNVLVLDEPTNDLDTESFELHEENLHG